MRPLPSNVHRFSYWHISCAVPTAASDLERLLDPDLQRVTTASDVERFNDRELRRLFALHVAGPCGEPGCRVDAKLSASSPARREVLALARTIRERTHQRPKRLQRALA